LLSVLVTLTVIATLGQGLHDLAIMGYPTIILFAGLMLRGRSFRICVGLTLAAMVWLVFGEAAGMFISKPYLTPNWVDFIVVTAVLIVAALGVELLAANIHANLDQARQEIARRKVVEDQLRYQSTHDVLTGIYNRSFFEQELAHLENSQEYPLSIIIADVDGLKLTNDRRGHAVGDQVLQAAAILLQSVFRSQDILARIGGDEFAVLLPKTDAAGVEQIMSRIQERLAEHNTVNPDWPVRLSGLQRPRQAPWRKLSPLQINACMPIKPKIDQTAGSNHAIIPGYLEDLIDRVRQC
jgi:diguanylate cyclase (GGDEF)-like protein